MLDLIWLVCKQEMTLPYWQAVVSKVLFPHSTGVTDRPSLTCLSYSCQDNVSDLGDPRHPVGVAKRPGGC